MRYLYLGTYRPQKSRIKVSILGVWGLIIPRCMCITKLQSTARYRLSNMLNCKVERGQWVQQAKTGCFRCLQFFTERVPRIVTDHNRSSTVIEMCATCLHVCCFRVDRVAAVVVMVGVLGWGFGGLAFETSMQKKAPQATPFFTPAFQ